MYRIDTPYAADTYQGLPGGTGHWQDTHLPSGTEFSAQWCEALQEEVCGVIEGLGGTLDKLDNGQLWDLLDGRVQGIVSHATDTGVVTTAHTRTVVGAGTSRASAAGANVAGGAGNLASGARAQVAGGADNTASGSNAQVAGGSGNAASGSNAQVAGGGNCIASAAGAHVAGSYNVENFNTYSIAGGFDVGATISQVGANQNLSWSIKSVGGHAHLAGSIKVGGDVDAGTGAKVTADGATGAIVADGKVTAAGGLETQAGTGTATYGTPWTSTVNAVGGTVTVPFSATYPLAAAFGGYAVVNVACNKIDDASRVQVTVGFAGGNGFPVHHIISSANLLQVVLMNADPTNAIQSALLIHFDVINPV